MQPLAVPGVEFDGQIRADSDGVKKGMAFNSVASADRRTIAFRGVNFIAQFLSVRVSTFRGGVMMGRAENTSHSSPFWASRFLRRLFGD